MMEHAKVISRYREVEKQNIVESFIEVSSF
jgi:hypothetical protein